MQNEIPTHNFLRIHFVLSRQVHHRNFVHDVVEISSILNIFETFHDWLAVLLHLAATGQHILAELLLSELESFLLLTVIDDNFVRFLSDVRNNFVGPLLELYRLMLHVQVALLLVDLNRRLWLVAVLRLLDSHFRMLERLTNVGSL